LAFLSLANGPAARRELVKVLAINVPDNRELFALELLTAKKVLGFLPRLLALSVEVSVHENRDSSLA